jgi:Cu(I)/Ag(I) efflux system protein CusF
LSVALFVTLALAACGQNAEPTANSGAPAAAMDSAAPMANSMSSNSAMPMGADSAAAAKTGESTAVVKAVDAASGAITLDHQPIPGVGWPAMTMTFKATPPSLLSGIKPGDKVAFSVRIQGDKNEVTAIRKQ